MADITGIFAASQHYSDFLDSFSKSCEKPTIDLDGTEISEAIFFHLCKMKYAGWRHRINFKRSRKHSLSDIFQDTIAFYLKTALPPNYTVELEPRIRKAQPDIAVKFNNRYIFLVEVKTTIGWKRPDTTANDPYKDIRDRIELLHNAFDVPAENIIYIYEEHSNVSREFSDCFWDRKTKLAKERPTTFPFSIIFPLFDRTDPYYWPHEGGFNPRVTLKEISDKEIRDRATTSVVTRFEDILKRIIDVGVRINESNDVGSQPTMVPYIQGCPLARIQELHLENEGETGMSRKNALREYLEAEKPFGENITINGTGRRLELVWPNGYKKVIYSCFSCDHRSYSERHAANYDQRHSDRLIGSGWWTKGFNANNEADFWVFYLDPCPDTITMQEHIKWSFLIIPRSKLEERLKTIHGEGETTYNIYFWYTVGKRCWETRKLSSDDRSRIVAGTYKNDDVDFTVFWNNWSQLSPPVA